MVRNNLLEVNNIIIFSELSNIWYHQQSKWQDEEPHTTLKNLIHL